MTEIGKQAPSFTLERDGETKISLKDLKGQWVVVYFYPKDATPGCTKQAIAFTEHADEFAKLDTVIVGISPDSVRSHDKFIQKYGLNIILASDEKRSAIESYEVWKEKKMYGRSYMGVERSTFLVDRRGIIQAVWRKVKVPGHVDEVLARVRELQK